MKSPETMNLAGQWIEEPLPGPTLHTYENGPLTEGWDCQHCAAPFEDGGTHVEHPGHPGLAFCRAECCAAYLTRESKKRTSNAHQVGFAL